MTALPAVFGEVCVGGVRLVHLKQQLNHKLIPWRTGLSPLQPETYRVCYLVVTLAVYFQILDKTNTILTTYSVLT